MAKKAEFLKRAAVKKGKKVKAADVIYRAKFAALILNSAVVERLEKGVPVVLAIDLSKFLVRDAATLIGLKVKASVFIVDGLKNGVGLEIRKA